MLLGFIISNMVILCSSTILCGNCGRIIDPKESEMPCIECGSKARQVSFRKKLTDDDNSTAILEEQKK